MFVFTKMLYMYNQTTYTRQELQPLLLTLSTEDKLWAIQTLVESINATSNRGARKEKKQSLARFSGMLQNAYPENMNYEEIRAEALKEKYGE